MAAGEGNHYRTLMEVPLRTTSEDGCSEGLSSWDNASPMLRNAAASLAFLACGVVLILVLNDDAQNGDWLAVLLACLGLFLGWQAASTRGTERLGLCLLPLSLLVVAIPFGEANKVTGGDDVWPVSIYMIAPVLASLIAAGIGMAAHTRYRRSRHQPAGHSQPPL